jgi:(1->4)-alpha-D-glucan 1-alpha-D-glucosylmutase
LTRSCQFLARASFSLVLCHGHSFLVLYIRTGRSGLRRQGTPLLNEMIPLMTPNIPTSTYRLQFQPEFGFDDAVRILPYLKALGVSHVYSSPFLQAAPGSTHGYDVVDHTRVNVELGGEEAFQRFVVALRENGIGHILDIVPNHMAIPGRENAWWWDVLRRGHASEFANYFDIDWSSGDEEKVLVPVLGDHYAKVLERSELKVVKSDHGDFVVQYYDNEFPIDEATFDGDADAVNADLDLLDDLIQRQHYRLAFWKVATDELDYRRFFDVNTLVALRMERPEVFDAAHGRIIEWVRSGVLDGVRIDHVDGLYDPAAYLRRLREAIGPDAHVLVEKILKSGERLPPSWPVSGTTGYEMLAYVNGLFVQPDGEQALDELRESFTASADSFDDIVWEGKTYIVDNILRSDVQRMADQFRRLTENHRQIRDYTSSQIHDVVRAMLIAFPVYRTYCVADPQQVTQTDIDYVDQAHKLVIERAVDVDGDLLQFFCDVLTMKVSGPIESSVAMRFQQTSGPVMAKGMEDTAFYRYLRLTSLNEVGCEPDHFTVRPDDFHAVSAEVQRLWPHAMVSSTTHDTKRSEDVRYRLHVLSEIPEAWGEAVRRWSQMNDRYRRPVRNDDAEGDTWPTRHDEYLFYQTLVGAFPLSTERAIEYMTKASKEAKLVTSWTEPNEGYGNALSSFVESALANQEFVDDVEAFVAGIADAGRLNALSATALKLTMPGVPDVYQGTELWTLTLVDPDNRQLVDYEHRAALLSSFDETKPADLMARFDEGVPKLYLLHKVLELRRAHPEWFDERSDYVPLWSSGSKGAHVLAFQRTNVVVVCPRLVTGIAGGWDDTTLRLPEGGWRNVLTGEFVSGGDVQLSTLLADFPVGIFTNDEGLTA